MADYERMQRVQVVQSSWECGYAVLGEIKMFQLGEARELTGNRGQAVLSENELKHALKSPHTRREGRQTAEAAHLEVIERGDIEKICIVPRLDG